MKKKVLSILVAAVMVMSLGACSLVKTSDDSAGGSSDTKKKEDGTLKVGYTVQSMENAYFVSIVEGMKAAAKEKGIELVVADAAADASKHISQIEDFVSQGVDAIIISPVDQEAPADAVKKAQEAGIPVISLDQEVKGSDAFFGIDEEEYGRLGGELAGQWLNEKESDGTIEDIANDKGEIEVVVVRYDQIPSVIKRADGLKQGLEDTYTGDRMPRMPIQVITCPKQPSRPIQESQCSSASTIPPRWAYTNPASHIKSTHRTILVSSVWMHCRKRSS